MQTVILCVLILWAFCGLCHGQECSTPDLEDSVFRYGVVNDVEIGVQYTGVIAEYTMVNTVSIASTSNSPMTNMYINARYDMDTRKLQIFATDRLAEYEQHEIAEAIRLTVMLACTSGGPKRFLFEQPLDEANNHAPVFGQSLYEFSVMLPLPRGFDLSFFQEVSARDLDIRNNKVHFTSRDAQGITVGTAQRVGNDGKTFYAALVTTNQLLTVGEQLAFSITATDSGKPARSAEAEIVIRANAEDVYIPVPQFVQAFYRGQLDNSRQLVLESLAITESTWNEKVMLTMTGRDAALFSVSFQAANVIQVQLAHSLTDADVAGKSVLLATVVAAVADVDAGRAAIVVEIPQSSTSPTTPTIAFDMALYVAELKATDLSLTAPGIQLIDAAGAEVDITTLDILLTGGDAAFFTLNRESNPIRVQTATTLSALDVQYRQFLMTTVTMTRHDVTGVVSATLLVNILHADSTTPLPRFERTLYNGRIDEENVLHADIITLEASTYSSDLKFFLLGTDAFVFAITVDRNELTLRLARALTDEESAKTVLMATIWALRSDGISAGSTEIIVTLPAVSTNPPTVQFEKIFYTGKIDVDNVLTLPSIVLLVSETTTDVVTFTLQDEDFNLLSITSEANVVTVTLRRSLTDADIAGQSYLKCSLLASINDQQMATTTILIDFPIVSKAEPQVPEFEKLMYSGKLDSGRHLQLETVLLKSATYSADLEFTLDGPDDSFFQLEQNLDKITITLRRQLTDADIIGRSHFSLVLVAKNPGVGVASTAIVIQLASVTCPPDSSQHVNDTLLIKYLMENQIHTDIMQGQTEDCEYVVISTIPNNAVYVRNDPDTHRITSIALDRESAAFEYMAVPQIEVQLQLVCDTDPKSSAGLAGDSQESDVTAIATTEAFSLDPKAIDGRTYVLTKSMTYAPRRTQLTIIIEDENDNAPQFVYPLTNQQLYGYPTGRLAELIMPEHLIRVRAIDADAGLNAVVRYTLNSNGRFQIDGKTGAVTPMRSSMVITDADARELNVFACDRDGAADGLCTQCTLLVRPLRVENILVISWWSNGVENGELEDADRFADRVYEAVGLELRVLRAARILGADNEMIPMPLSEMPLNVLRMFVYAPGASDIISNATVVQQILVAFNNTATISGLFSRTMVEHLADLDLANGVVTVSNAEQLALIIACAVLAVLLLLSIVGTFVMWWLKIRPYEFRLADNDGTDSESVASQRHLVAVAASEKRIAMRGPDSTVVPESNAAASVFAISGTTTNAVVLPTDTADDASTMQSQLSRDLIDRLTRLEKLQDTEVSATSSSSQPPPPPPPPPPAAPKAGVKFNELVERIDILVQPDIDDDDKKPE